MKCSVCKNCSPHLTKIEKKLFCDQCKPNLIKVKTEAAPIKQGIDPDSHDSSDSSSIHFSLQKKLKREINIQEDDETVDSENHSLDMSFNSMETYDNAGTSDSSWSIPTATVAKPKKQLNVTNKKDKKLKCYLCDYRCNTISSIGTHHMKVHPELGTFRCKICYRSFKGLLNLDKHIDEKHDGFGAKCKFCLEKLKRDQRLAHQRECEGRHLFSCGTCGKRYVKLESLMKHLDEHGVAEAKKELSIVKTRTKVRLFICVICEEGLVYDEDPYWKHVKEQHDGHYLRCDDCGETFKRSRSWLKHKKSYCKDGPAQDRFIPQEIFCPHCSKSCTDKTSLATHMYNNHTENLFSCNECGKKFHDDDAYRYHKTKVHSKPRYECNQCPKKFHHLSNLKLHLQSHERGPLECKICGITFKLRLALSQHNYLKHRPREALECKQCSKRFNLRTHYTIHIRKNHGGGSRNNTSQTMPTAASETTVEK